MFKLSQFNLTTTVVFFSAALTIPALAGSSVGEKKMTKRINIKAPSHDLQSKNSPMFHPGEYLRARYFGTVSWQQNNPQYNWMNVRNGRQPLDIWNRSHYPSFLHRVPGHNPAYIGGDQTLGPIRILEQGVFATHLKGHNAGRMWDIGAKNLHAKVDRYEGCFDQKVKVHVRNISYKYFSANLEKQWCVYDEKISDVQMATLNNVYDLNYQLAFKGTDIQSANWLPNARQKKRRVTTSFPQFTDRVKLDIPFLDTNEDIWQPAIKFIVRHDGKWRIVLMSSAQTFYSDWYDVTNDRKSVTFTIPHP